MSVIENRLHNPRLAVNSVGWSTSSFWTGGGSTPAITLNASGGPSDAPTFGSSVPGTVDTEFRVYAQNIPSVPPPHGLYSFGGWVRVNGSGLQAAPMARYFVSHPEGSGLTADKYAEPVALVANQWTWLSGTYDPWLSGGTPGSVDDAIQVTKVDGSAFGGGILIDFTGFVPTLDVTRTTPYTGTYFDGSTAATYDTVYEWAGIAHDSVSYAVTEYAAPSAAMSRMATATPVVQPSAPGVAPRAYSELKLNGYSSVEDSTPIDPSDTTGGSGQFTLEIDEAHDTKFLMDIPVDLVDVAQGKTRGTVRGIGGQNGLATLTVDSRMTLLAVTRQAQPFTGTLAAAWDYYLGLVGLVDGIVVDPTIASRPVVFPGFSGNVWDHMKQMAVAEQVEMSLVSNNVVLRPLRGRVAEMHRNSSVAHATDASQLARSVEIWYYNNEYDISRLAYPAGGWNDEVQVFSNFDAGTTTVFSVEAGGSLTSVDQPTAVDFVDSAYDASSVYSITGNDGLIVPAAQWAAGGGSVTFAISEDTRSIDVTVVASIETQYAPYTIAMPSGPNTNYSSLRIVGEGVFQTPQMLTLATSVDHERVSTEVGATVENQFISTLEQAYHAGMWMMKRWGSPRRTVTITTTGINRLGDSGSYSYPTFDDINAAYAGMTFDDVNALWSGDIQEFNDFWTASTENDFVNQAFGNVAGARIALGDSMFRVRTATITPAGITMTAEEDTTFDDVNAAYAGLTLADVNAIWAGASFAENTAAPMKVSA